MNATLERTEIEEAEEEVAVKAPTLAAGSSLDPTDIFTLKDVSVSYDGVPAVAGVNLTIPAGKVTALIGPSGCGKSTLLRCFNRMNDELGNVEVGGSFTLDGEEINDRKVDPVALRMKVGQVFQRPNPFPMSIYDNVAYGPRLQGIRAKSLLNPIVERSLKAAALWTEVKDSLKKHAFELSGGQQQRLCIARALAAEPEVILMDEPCASLDPISTKQIEDTIISLKGRTTIIIVTHSMTQARRVSDQCIYMLRESMEHPARVIEVGETEQVFTDPRDERTAAYINGHFG